MCQCLMPRLLPTEGACSGQGLVGGLKSKEDSVTPGYLVFLFFTSQPFFLCGMLPASVVGPGPKLQDRLILDRGF